MIESRFCIRQSGPVSNGDCACMWARARVCVCVCVGYGVGMLGTVLTVVRRSNEALPLPATPEGLLSPRMRAVMCFGTKAAHATGIEGCRVSVNCNTDDAKGLVRRAEGSLLPGTRAYVLVTRACTVDPIGEKTGGCCE